MVFRKEIFDKLAFEKHYIRLRQEEERILDLEAIRMLPNTSPDYTHHQEWNLRKGSTQRILAHLKGKKDIHLLDIGCGNGWFLNKAAPIASHLTGIDVNQEELKQAAEVLKTQDHVTLIYGNLFEVNFEQKYDIILLNACLQYFDNLPKLLARLFELMRNQGEIHIIDSPIYPSRDAADRAKQRSERYYKEKEIAEMADFYFHHSFEELKGFDYQVKYNPFSLFKKLKRKLLGDSPFYWIMITN